MTAAHQYLPTAQCSYRLATCRRNSRTESSYHLKFARSISSALAAIGCINWRLVLSGKDFVRNYRKFQFSVCFDSNALKLYFVLSKLKLCWRNFALSLVLWLPRSTSKMKLETKMFFANSNSSSDGELVKQLLISTQMDLAFVTGSVVRM